jgi:putative Holliday junction resolvase
MEIILGLDYSKRKIGVATGQTLTGTASPLTTIKNADKGQVNWSELDDIVAQWKPTMIVLGLPLNMDGKEQDTSTAVRKFSERLQKRYQLVVNLMDERLSSREASHILGYDGITSPRRNSKPGKKVKKNKRNGSDIDSVAAQLILQTWLNENGC